MTCADKILLRKRNVIESVNDELKNIATIEHSRHRSVTNFLTNTLAAVAAYQYFPKNHHLTSYRNTPINSYYSNFFISNSLYLL